MKKTRRKLPEILNYKEKKKFIQTLLIIAGLITVFNTEAKYIFSIFTLFIVSSLGFIIWISIMEKSSKERKQENKNYIQFVRGFISSTLSYSFAAIIAVVGIRELTGSFIAVLFGGFLLLGLYIVLGSFLNYVLYKEKED